MTRGATDRHAGPPTKAPTEAEGAAGNTGPLPPFVERAALRLRAVDAEDLSILSAQLQDAIVPVADMAYLPDRQTFAMVVNRFMWECGPMEPHEAEESGRDGPMCPLYLRTNCGVEVRHVTKVRSRGIDLRDRGQMLCLLALCPEEGAIDLHFSGSGVIRLSVAAIDCRVRDIDEPWPTGCRPAHPVDDEHAPEGGQKVV